MPGRIVLACAFALATGIYLGGWRITSTLSADLPVAASARLCAEAIASTVAYLTAFVIAAHIASTQVMTTSFRGAAATRRISAVRCRGPRRDWDGLSTCTVRRGNNRCPPVSPGEAARAQLTVPATGFAGRRRQQSASQRQRLVRRRVRQVSTFSENCD